MFPSSLQWLSLVGIIWLQSMSGTNSDFPAYSSQLKHLLSISQIQLNNLAFASDAGKLFGWFSGIAALHLPLWLVLVIGTTLGLVGYGIQFLFLVNQITSLPYWQIFLLSCLAGNSVCWINTVSYLITIRNFPSDQQIAVGLATSYVGLSAKIYTAMITSIFRPPPNRKASTYLLLNSVVPIVISILTAPLIREVELISPTQMGGEFAVLFTITVATGIYAVISSVGYVSSQFSPTDYAAGLGVLLVAPLIVPVVNTVREGLKRRRSMNRVRGVNDFNFGEISIVGGNLESNMKEEGGEIRVREEIGVKMMVRRVEFWLYYFVYMFGATLGLAFCSNLGQIAESRWVSNTSSLVSLSSSFGFFGRLMPSLLEYFFSKSKNMVSRPAFIGTLMAPMAGAFFLLLNSSELALYISTAIVGVCSGAITSLTISMTRDLFGTKNFSINHNILVTNIPIGSFLFGYLAALFYQREVDEEHGRCMGGECYRKTFIIWGSVCSLGSLLSFMLYVRTRKDYLQRS
ncbi:major facilitator superfamily protein [Tasmannia lanceolata]|uniref:major facilitator superfamily protein n=1 Tax=Tasmannia lanceolata TaxID=3420 RepID=UPI00406384CC